MIRFDKEVVEGLCKTLLTAEENRHKIVKIPVIVSNAVILDCGVGSEEYDEYLVDLEMDAKELLRKIGLARLIREVVRGTGAKAVEVGSDGNVVR